MRYNSLIRRFCLIAFSSSLLLLTSCSQKKNTLTSRTYHSLTAHYNGLYWANVSITEGVDNLARAHKDDYSQILPIFRYADMEAAKANTALFDRAIEKTNKVIQYHSMMIEGKERNRWIDENYMALGKSHFYKRDYFAAVTVFEYVVKVFQKEPAKFDAFLWLVRCYNQMNSVLKTGPILDLLKHDKKMPRYLLDDYYSVLADYYLRMEQPKKAKDALVKAISLTRKKYDRGRYNYILAQLAEQENDFKRATEYYTKCAKLHPSYEMEFNARLSKARTFQVDKSNSKELKAELTKMLKDEKNKEYKDQIYYALGNLAQREGNTTEAVNLFKESAHHSISNPKQKGRSYLKVADIYFDEKEYKKAQPYYDSTMAFIPQDFKNYDQIKNKKETLSALIKNMNIVIQQDSLLRLGSMDTTQLNKKIDDLIVKIAKEEEAKKIAEEQKSAVTMNSSLSDETSPAVASSVGAWYFYNPSTVAFGFSEFFKKWGNRPLEDNWRRSNKEVILADQTATQTSQDSAGKTKVLDAKSRKFYLKDIPFTDKQKQKANDSIANAYYAMGGIYKEDLHDNAGAAQTFEELLKRYPSGKYTLNLYYQLYRIFLALKNNEKSNYYKAKILKEYPDSEYARIINNPDSQKALNASQNEIEKYYGETYAAYRAAQYDNVLAMASRADSFYAASSLMPKFALLRAFSIGKTQNAKEYEHSLQGIIARYPKDEVKDKAQELLDFLKSAQKPAVTNNPAEEKRDTLKQLYSFNDTAKHACMIIYSDKDSPTASLQKKVSDFNAQFFLAANLTLHTEKPDSASTMIYVEIFETAAKAKEYQERLNQDGQIFSIQSPVQYSVYPISKNNLEVLLKEKDLNSYKEFYQLFYKP